MMRRAFFTGLLAFLAIVFTSDALLAQCGRCLEDSNPLGHSLVNAIMTDYDGLHSWVWGSRCATHDAECGSEEEEEQDGELLAMALNAFTLTEAEVQYVATALGGHVSFAGDDLLFPTCEGGITQVPLAIKTTSIAIDGTS